MFRHNLFSNRRKEKAGEVPDVYIYDQLSPKVRLQLARIIERSFGRPQEFSQMMGHKWLLPYEQINAFVAEEHGRVTLGTGYDSDARNAIYHCLQNENDLDIVFDLLEISLRVMEGLSYDYRTMEGVQISQQEAIEQVNDRLRENGIGFYFENGKFVKIDDEHTHSEAIKPALELLRKSMYVGANAEFGKAFGFYKDGDYENSMVEATKALESVLKAICTKRQWHFDPNSTVKKLIDVVLKANLVPTYLQQNFTSLVSLMESAATPRNKAAGHGQGATIRKVPQYFAQFALNMTATVIVLLAKAEEDLT